MIISAIAFSIMNAVAKYLSHFSAYQIVFFRSIGTLCFTVPLLIKAEVSFFGNNRKLLILRGVFGVISLICFFQSLNYLAVGTAVSLRYTSPIFAAIFALFLLKEKIKFIQWILFAITFAGVIVIKGFDNNVNYLGLLFVLISAILLGLVFVIIRKIGNTEHPLVIINYSMFLCFILGGLMTLKYWQKPNFNEWVLLLSLGLFGYVGQLYMTKALQAKETNLVAPIKYFEAILAIIIGAFWFGEMYTWFTLLGISMIVFGLVLNIYIKSKK